MQACVGAERGLGKRVTSDSVDLDGLTCRTVADAVLQHSECICARHLARKAWRVEEGQQCLVINVESRPNGLLDRQRHVAWQAAVSQRRQVRRILGAQRSWASN